MSVIGASTKRVGGVERVTGALRFVGDIHVEGMLHVKLVTLDVGRAQVLSIDTSKALAVPGIQDVVTAEDLPQPVPRFGPMVQDRPVMAVGETRFHGEPVAAVVADTLDAAKEAAELVKVDYEELQGVYTIADALDPEAPLVHDPATRDDEHQESNALNIWNFGWGELDAADPDLVLEHTYTFPMAAHFAIEPHGFIVAPDPGGVRVWSATQHPYLLQRTLAQMLELPLSKVRVHAPDLGGGFGGKGYPKYEPLLALLMQRVGRPVRLVLTLEETFQAARREGAEIRARTGFRSDGTIVFHDVDCNFLIGAYADIGPRVVAKSSYMAAGPYRIPTVRIVSRALYSHTPPSTAYRGFGAPQVAWALESQVDEAARQLGIDRLQIRLKNLAQRGEDIVPGDTPADGNYRELLTTAAAAIDWNTELPENTGRGIAIGLKSSATVGASYAIMRLLADGSVVLMAGTSDMGQGARTVLAQIAAQELDMSPDNVSITMGDTGSIPFDLSTSACRSTVFMGRATMEACAELRRQARELAAELYGYDLEDIHVQGGYVILPDEKIHLADLVKERFGAVGGELIAVGAMRGEADPEHPLNGSPWFYEVSVTAVEANVDTETGVVDVRRHIVVGDIGRAINKQHVEMQDEGAAIMGLGHALMEHLILGESGQIMNLGALDYRVPCSMDVPLNMKSMVVENADGPGPYGAKGTGESGLLATAPAIASAVADATGAVIRDLPLTPQRVWEALHQER